MKKKNLLLFVIFMFLMSACAGAAASTVEDDVPTPSLPPTAELKAEPTEDPMVKGIRTIYVDSPHAETISCEVCHSAVEGALQRELSWIDQETGQIEAVSDASKLCIKCHPSQDTADWIAKGTPLTHPEYGCIDCHNAHTTQASCTQSACHSDIRETLATSVEKPDGHPEEGDPNNNYMCGGAACHDLVKKALGSPIYHQYTHSQVPCTVCHDASGMAVDKEVDLGWITIANSDQGNDTTKALVSHIIGREVTCKKCHSSDNPWSLPEIEP